jgi:uncharacterized protein
MGEGWLARLLGVALLCSSLLAHAEVPVPPLEKRVTDLTGTLAPDQQAALESRLSAFEQQKGSQIAVLIVPSTQPEDIAQYSIRVVEQWKLGRKSVDDGVLLLVAKDDRTLRIEVGYGLEGAIPDAIAKRIIEEIILPRFRQGDFAGGIIAGTDRLMRVIQGEPLPEPVRTNSNLSSVERNLPLIFFAVIIIGGLLRALLGNFTGGLLTGSIISFVIWTMGAGLIFALILGIIAFFVTLGGGRGFHGGGMGGGGGFSSGGGGFSGGGGGFGGGGASGRW